MIAAALRCLSDLSREEKDIYSELRYLKQHEKIVRDFKDQVHLHMIDNMNGVLLRQDAVPFFPASWTITVHYCRFGPMFRMMNSPFRQRAARCQAADCIPFL
jgi:hypothetical protein